VPRSQRLPTPVGVVHLQLGLAVDAVALGDAVDWPPDGGLHGALEVDLAHLLGRPGVASLLTLHLSGRHFALLHRDKAVRHFS
jgi:hypothetical protein